MFVVSVVRTILTAC